jgi:predicted nucleic acid-binding protein
VPLVVDASALVEIVLVSDRAPALRRAIGDARMVAPDTINPEVLSALRGLERSGKIEPERAQEAVGALRVAPVQRVPTLAFIEAAWALRDNLSSYDACYAALATALGCPLVTADARLASAPLPGVPVIVAT